MRLLIAASICLTASVAFAVEDFSGKYLCIASSGAGMRYDVDKDDWRPLRINSEDERIIIELVANKSKGVFERKNYEVKSYEYNIQLRQFGEDNGDALPCRTSNPYIFNSVIECKSVLTSYVFNAKERRFLLSRDYAFGMPKDKNVDDIAMHIGECSKFK